MNPVRRLAFVYTPNGMIMEAFTPPTEGGGFALPPILEPLAAFRDQFLVLSGLNNNAADPLPGEGQTAPHGARRSHLPDRRPPEARRRGRYLD